jgi:pSer/pThr/pTyr-binding forkhead associated (FHA) protein
MYFDISGRAELLLGRVDPYSNVFPEIDLTAHGGDEGGVSRRHCRITLAGNQYFAEDLGSSNGTMIGSTRLPPNVRTELHNGDQLRLGKVVLNFYTGQ